MQPIGEGLTGLAEGDALLGGQALDHAVADGVEMIAFQYLQPQPDRVGQRKVGREHPCLHRAAHARRRMQMRVRSRARRETH